MLCVRKFPVARLTPFFHSSETPIYLASRISSTKNRIVIASVTNAGIHENLSKGVINIKGIPTSCQMREGTTETNNHTTYVSIGQKSRMKWIPKKSKQSHRF